jgi:hypothetical protein
MGFSAEMKDFINAYDKVTGTNVKNQSVKQSEATTDETLQRTKRENDPTRLALADKLAQLRVSKMAQSIAHAGEDRVEASQANAAYLDLLKRQNAKGALAVPGATGAPDAPAAPVIEPRVIPERNRVNSSLENPLAPTTQVGALDLGEDTTLYGAEGGLVPDEMTEEQLAEARDMAPARALMATPAPRAAVPMEADDDDDEESGAGYDIGAQRRQAATTRTSRAKPQEPEVMANGAIRGGYDYANKLIGPKGGVKTMAQVEQLKAIAAGQGGYTDEEVAALGKSVDPKGEMSESTRKMVGLGSMYQHYLNQGDPEKAQRVAFQLLQNYRSAATRYSALAARAAEGGDMDTAMKAMLKAHANVPDGRDMSLMQDPDDPNKLMYSFTDEHGKTIVEGIATPKELAAQAMGLAKGGFDKAILTAAGQREAAAGAPAVGGAEASGRKTPQSAGDLEKQGQLIKTEVDKLGEQWLEGRKKQPGNTDTEVPPNFTGDVSDAAQFVLANNLDAKKQLTPREAAMAGLWLSQPGTKDPQKPDFAVKEDMQDDLKTGNSTVRFKNGLTINLPTERLAPMLEARQARVDRAVAEINRKNEEGDQPGVVANTIKNVGAIGDAFGRYNEMKKGEYAEGNKAVEDFANTALESARTRGAAGAAAARDLAGDFFSWIKKGAQTSLPTGIDRNRGHKAIPDELGVGD